ncbi:MAG: CotH kinase family protein [Verrucomicrobiota bacterium]
MKNQIGLFTTVLCLGLTTGQLLSTRAADGSVELRFPGSNVQLKVDGDKDDDWWLQTSTNLTTWTTLTNLGTLLSGNETNAPWRTVGTKGSVPTYYRALQTAGLYDPTIFRTVSMTFTQTSLTTISNLLTAARTYSSNVYAPMLTLDNGATNYHIGARFKGNTSFTMGGAKKSFNIEFDSVDTNANLMGYTTINLNNAAGDETIMREPLYFSVMSEYCCSPKAALARVYINGSDRGVYSLAQQENSELIKGHFSQQRRDTLAHAEQSQQHRDNGVWLLGQHQCQFLSFLLRPAQQQLDDERCVRSRHQRHQYPEQHGDQHLARCGGKCFCGG